MISRGQRDPASVAADDGWRPDDRGNPLDVAALAEVGTDLGFTRNSSACAASRMGEDRIVTLLGWEEWRPRAGVALVPSHVFAGVVDFAAQHRAARAWGDGHARESAKEVYGPAGLAFADAPSVPADAYLEVRRLLQEDRVRGLDVPGVIHGALRPDEHVGLLRRQLEAARVEYLAGGYKRVVVPQTRDGRHGDVMSACVLSLWAASRGRAYTRALGGRLARS